MLDRLHVCVMAATDSHNNFCVAFHFAFRNRDCFLTFSIRMRKTIHLAEKNKEVNSSSTEVI